MAPGYAPRDADDLCDWVGERALVPVDEWRELLARLGDDHRRETYQVEDGWIELRSGTQFFFKNPTPEMIHIEDIAYSLGKTARYAGHTTEFYSVAEHSVHIARYLRRRLVSTRKTIRTALLHDGTEYVLPDMPRPIKHTLPQFKVYEGVVYAAMAIKFDLHDPMPAIIRELDSRILVDERQQAMSDSGNEWGTDHLEPLGVEIEFWTPDEAADAFLREFHNCQG